MLHDDAADPLAATRTTRRSIVKKGIKLAYAVPVVAFTIKLGADRAEAVSGGPPPTPTIGPTPTPTCTPSGHPCDLANPGACCSQICVNTGQGAVCF